MKWLSFVMNTKCVLCDAGTEVLCVCVCVCVCSFDTSLDCHDSRGLWPVFHRVEPGSFPVLPCTTTAWQSVTGRDCSMYFLFIAVSSTRIPYLFFLNIIRVRRKSWWKLININKRKDSFFRISKSVGEKSCSHFFSKVISRFSREVKFQNPPHEKREYANNWLPTETVFWYFLLFFICSNIFNAFLWLNPF